MMRPLPRLLLFVTTPLLSLAACGDDGSPSSPVADVVGGDALAGDATSGGDTEAPASDALGDTASPGDQTGSTDAGPTPDTSGDTTEPPLLEGCPGELPEVPTRDLCTVEGDGPALLIRGDVALPEGILARGQVLVIDGYVRCSGCECADLPEAADATIITCPEGLVTPGLINAHDHITFTQMDPRPHGTVRWSHRNEWRRGLNGLPKIDVEQNPNALGDAWGELRQVLAGTTSLFGSGGERGFLRNLDRAALLEGLSHEPASYETFPVHPGSGGLIVNDGCDQYTLPAANELDTPAWVPHVAEGIVAGARNEFLCLSGSETDGVDMIEDNTSFIHGIGMTAGDIALFAGEGGTLVWSPRSNVDLYGFTAEAPTYHRLGSRVALGTDWTASGSVNILRELACAEEWNARWGDYFTERQLLAMVTEWAAAALGFEDKLGSLTPGKVADIAIWDGRENRGYRAVLDAGVEDVALVLRGGDPLSLNGETWYRRGRPLYGDLNLVTALAERALNLANYDQAVWGPGKKPLPEACETYDVCGAEKLICVAQELEAAQDNGKFTTKSLAEFVAELGPQSYDLFFCDAPDLEPTCVPSRPNEFDGVGGSSDGDGDGVADSADNCPGSFNAIRPIDGAAQADADGDGEGDACDVCPLDADATACTSSYDPEDIDRDGVLNGSDNCPSVANPGQEDSEAGGGDGIGDACDACPDEVNIGGAPCTATIVDIKSGAVEPGAVLVRGVVVTAIGPDFYTVQSPGAAVEFGGLYVYTAASGAKPALGDLLDVSGDVADYFGQTQIGRSSFTKTGVAEVPAPLVIAAADAAPGGSKEKAYEALLVEVRDVTVLSTTPPGQGNEIVTNELLVTGNLSVDDQIHKLEPFPIVGDTLASVKGVLRFARGRNKLLPRGEGDVVRGAATLAGFSPEAAVARVGLGEVALFEVEMSRAVAADTAIALGSDTPSVLTVPASVVIPAGSRSAVVRGTGLAEGDATVTATLGAVSVQGDVVVIGATVPSVVTDLSAQAATVAPGGTFDLTVTLDLPAPAGGTTVALTSTVDLPTLPATVLVPAGELEASFSVDAPELSGSFTLTAATGDVAVDLALTVAIEPTLGAAFCFQDAAGAGSTAASVTGSVFTTPTVAIFPAVTAEYVSGNTIAPLNTVCPASSGNQALTGKGWPAAAAFSEAGRHFKASFGAPAGQLYVRFDLRRSSTGPAKLAVWTKSGGVVAQGIDIPTSFTAASMFSYGPIPLAAGTEEVRIYAYGAGSAEGTLRIDNLFLSYLP
jgi:cytosine/adenosine deaminase-related metal-dependent hydrolase